MPTKWSNFEAVQQMLEDTARLPDTYITMSRMLPENRETQIADHPWDEWEEVRHWSKKVIRSLDPGPEGVKLRIRVFKKGGKPVRSIVSLVQGDGKGPPPIALPSPPPSTSPAAPVALTQPVIMPGFCPSCISTQALMAAKQLQIVDLEARLERTHADKREVETRLADALAKLRAEREKNVDLRAKVKDLEEYQEAVDTAIEQARATMGDDD